MIHSHKNKPWMNKRYGHGGEVQSLRGSLCFEGLGLTAFLHAPLAIRLNNYTEDSTCESSFFPSKHALSGLNKAVLPCWPVTCGQLLVHTDSLFTREKYTPGCTNAALNRFLQLSCLSLSLQTIKKSHFILALSL